jgi:penicillin V acylase-like amidase (Ntn superfamily)
MKSDSSISKNNLNIEQIQTDSKLATLFLPPNASSSQERFVTISESTRSDFQSEKQTKKKISTIQTFITTTLKNYETSKMPVQLPLPSLFKFET